MPIQSLVYRLIGKGVVTGGLAKVKAKVEAAATA